MDAALANCGSWIVGAGLLTCVFAGTSAASQILHVQGSQPSFAVASIRPSQPEEAFNTHTIRADSFRGRAMTVKQLVAFAYGIAFEDQVLGGPGWIRTEKFDVEAKPDEAEAAALSKATQDDVDEQMRLMVQSLLQERFSLRVSFAKKALPGYELVIARNGLKCQKVAADSAFAKLPRPRFQWTGMPPPPPPPPGWTPPTPDQPQTGGQAMHLRTKTWPFWLLLTAISVQPEIGGRVVVDKTGLEGNYDCEASWSRAGSDGLGPSFFTAIQDQMGLKLKPAKVPSEVLTIEHVESPTAN